MSAAVIREFCMQYPDVGVVVVTRAVFEPFFTAIPGVVFHPIQPETIHRGSRGLFRLFRELLVYTPHVVADLHHNIRSRVLSMFFRFKGIEVRHIDKGRAEKKALTRSTNKIMRPLKTTIERYADVFRQLGYDRFSLTNELRRHPRPLPAVVAGLFSDSHQRKVGISPFAQHAAKAYPLERMEVVVDHLNQQEHAVFIFGGGETERKVAESWQRRYPHVHSVIGQFSLQEELDTMAHLDLMVSMDSAGMHMASLMGVRVLSIWGGTHPYAGFLGYGQRMTDCIQVEHPSRPSSVYGNKPCICDGRDSMELIDAQLIIAKLKSLGL